MNFIGKGIGGDSGGRRQQQRGGEGGNSLEEDDEEERQNTGPAGQFFPSSSSSSPSSPHHHHHHHHHHHQQPQLQPQPTYHHPRGGWMHEGEPSASRILSEPNDNHNHNNDDDEHQQSEGGMMMVVEREHMFDKVVTPSDVGKLNRLVIPKQHAERYFPLDSSNNDKGLLLNFEDRNGKPWRFRYSYWNSSQSYVMTKGWSRFVKDKKLDAGDIVSFQRGVGGSAKDRLFIDWRHRPDAPPSPYQFPLPNHQFNFNRSNIHPWSPLFLQSQVPAAPSRSTIHSNLMLQPSNNSYRYGGPYQNIGTGSVVNVNQGGSGSIIYFRSGGIPHQHVDMMQMHQRSGLMDPPALPPPPPLQPPSAVVFESVPVVHGKAAPKRLRLFGVNMDCPISNEDDQDYELPPTTITMVSNSSTTSTNTVPSSSSTIPYEQLMPYQEETHESTTMSSSSTDPLNKTTKSSSSRMSLDFGI